MKLVKFGDVYVNPDQIAYVKKRSEAVGVTLVTLCMSDGRTLEKNVSSEEELEQLFYMFGLGTR